MTTVRRVGLLAAILWLGTATLAAAQEYPSRPVSIVVPYAAGGPTDLVARVLAAGLTEELGRPVIVENRAGAGGNIGAELVARSRADGHMLLMGTTGVLTINRHLQPNAQFDAMRDLVPISLTFKTDHAVIVNPGIPANTLAELIELMKKNPDGFAYGSAGIGSTSHMIAELFKSKAGVSIRHVAYRGAGPALSDLIGGHIQVMVDSLANSIGQIQSGKARVLAVTGRQRHPQLPHVPTVAEAAVPDFNAIAWGALLAPRGTPEPIVARLSAAARIVLSKPQNQERLSAAGADAVFSTPQDLAAYMQAETNQWERIVRDGNLASN